MSRREGGEREDTHGSEHTGPKHKMPFVTQGTSKTMTLVTLLYSVIYYMAVNSQWLHHTSKIMTLVTLPYLVSSLPTSSSRSSSTSPGPTWRVEGGRHRV